MEISPKIIASVTIFAGVLAFGALMSEARSAGIRPPTAETVSEIFSALPGSNQIETVAMSADAQNSGTIRPQSAVSSSDIMMLTDPEPPALPQPRTLQLAQAEAPSDGRATPALSPFGLPCGLSVSASATVGGIVALDIMDPCQSFARVVVEHSGLNLTGQTDVMGLLTMDVPAFENPAFFTVRMPDGTSESALAMVPDLGDFVRVGLQWNEDMQLELHALEFGASYDDPGHVWQENPGSVAAAIAGEGGFLTSVGDASVQQPMLAQIYTFPRDTLAGSGNIRLSIEAPVTETNCGQRAIARTLDLAEDGQVAVVGLTFTLPGCDAVGDYLLLQNLLQDLRVASN